jgi:uncharacterized membrane protein
MMGWGLRMHNAENRSLWEDEGWTMKLSMGPGLGTVTRTLAADQHPPLFFMQMYEWRRIAGDSEFSARYLGILFGVLAIAAIYQLGKELFNPLTGILAALLLALVDNHIDLSQEARHYAAMATWAILSSLFYIRWWRHPNRTHRIGYVLTSLALLYTHYLGGFLMLAQAAHLLITVRPWSRWLQGLSLMGFIGLGFAPWLPVMIDQNRLRWDNPLYYQNSVPNSLQTYRAVRMALFGSHYGVMIGLLLIGLVYISYQHRTQIRLRPVGPVLYPVLWIGLMVGLTVYINGQRQFLTERNFLLITPALMILIGHGLANLERTARLLLVTIILGVSLTTVDSRRHYPDYRAVTQNVTDYHLDHEPILMDIWVGDFPVRYYIDQQMGEDTPRVSLREWRDTYGFQFRQMIKNYLEGIDSFWLIYWGDNPDKEHGGSSQYADLITDAGFQQTAVLSVDHMGTPLYSFRYDRLTDETIAVFGDLIALRRSYNPVTATPGDTIPITLWWTAEQPLPLDYSMSVFLLDDANNRIAPHDAPPLNGASPTSAWQPGDLKYDIHPLTLPANLPTGTYRVGVSVYWYGDSDHPLQVSGENYAVLGTLQVK